MYSLLRFVPKNHVSFIAGKLAKTRLSKLLIPWFVRFYEVNVSELPRPIDTYQSLGEFFTRDIKEKSRPVGEGVVSPVDGRLVEFGEIEEETLLQAKGKSYTLSQLLRSKDLAETFRDGFFATFYLAPPDYHHIHSPVDGNLVSATLIEGCLWPVNAWSVENVEGLFAINERVVTLLESSGGRIAVVKVGATNVGSISVTYDSSLVSNKRPKMFQRGDVSEHREYSMERVFARGERLGTFHLGSTVILLFQKNSFVPTLEKGPVQCGQSIGMLEDL